MSAAAEDRLEFAGPIGTKPSAPRWIGPVTLLQIYAVLLLLLPPMYIIEPLGAIGTPASVVGLLALGLWGFALVAPGTYLHRTVLPLRVVMGALVGVTLLAYAILHTHAVPGDELLSSDRTILKVLSWTGVALLAAEGLRDREELYRVLRVLTIAAALMAVVGALQFYAAINPVDLLEHIPFLSPNIDLSSILDRAGFRRPAATTSHPIEFGCVIAMILPIALHLARFDTGRRPLRRWLPFVACALGVPVAVSRSAIVCAVTAVVVVFLGLDPKYRLRALTAFMLFAVVVYATTPGLLGAIRDLFVYAGSDTSITLRTSDYEVVSRYVQESPLFGRGPGTFLPARYIFLDNQYLLSVIEIGLVGLFVVVAYLLATAALGRGARHRSTDPAVRDLGQAFAATGLTAAVGCFTFDGFSFLVFAGVIPLCLGLAGVLWKMTRVAQAAPALAR